MWVFSHKVDWIRAPYFYVQDLLELGRVIKACHQINPMSQSCTIQTKAFKASGSTGKIYAFDRDTAQPIEQYNLRYKTFITQWRGFLNPDGSNCYISHSLYPAFANTMIIECRESVKERCVVMG